MARYKLAISLKLNQTSEYQQIWSFSTLVKRLALFLFAQINSMGKLTGKCDNLFSSYIKGLRTRMVELVS